LRGWRKISCDMIVLLSCFVCLLLHVISVHFSVVFAFVLVLLGVLFVLFFLRNKNKRGIVLISVVE